MNDHDDDADMSMEEIIAAEGGAFADERDLPIPMTGCDRLPHGFTMTARGLRYHPEGAEHSAYVILLDKRGRQRIGFPGDKVTPEGIVRDLRTLERE